MIILSTTFLVSCNDKKLYPQVIHQTSFQFNRCRVNCFDFMKFKKVSDKKCDVLDLKKLKEDKINLGKYFSLTEIKKEDKKIKYYKFKSGNYPLLECDETLGFKPDIFATRIKPPVNVAIKRYKNKVEGD